MAKKNTNITFMPIVEQYRNLYRLLASEQFDILSEDELVDVVDMKKKEIIKQHKKKHSIWLSSDGRWHTKVPDPTKPTGTKQIARTTEDSLLDAIVSWYAKDANPETLEDLYPQWLEYKAAETSLANAHSLGNDWAKYYEGDPLTRRKMASIKVPELLQWFLRKIAEHNLTRRKFRDMKTVLNSMLDYAVGMGFVEKNVSRYVPGISTKHFAIEVRKDKTERVYLEDETGSLIDVCLERFEKTHNTAYLGICMNLYLGLRVGELIALKVSDFSDSFVHIEREEIKHHEKKGNVITRNGYEVAPYVKTPQSVRDVPLTSQARRFLSMILAENEKNGVHSEYVFLDKKTGERLHNDSINNILRKYVNPRLNTPQKANHSLRRTYLSTLDASGRLTDEEIREVAGHRHISTTRDNYLYSRKEDSHKVLAFEKALCGNSVTPDNQNVTSKSQNAKAPETA